MFKDPLYQDMTPYDVLGLSLDASSDEVNQAFQRFIRNPENRLKIREGQDAARKLRNPKDRLKIDILYYHIGEMESDDQPLPELENTLKEFYTVPVYQANDMYNDLKKEDITSYFSNIVKREVAINEIIAKYDDLQTYRVDIVFDK